MSQMRLGKIERWTVGARVPCLLLAIALVLLAGCAAMRHYDVTGRIPSLEGMNNFYVVVNGATQRVEYDHFRAALIPGYTLDYEKYAKGRIREGAKLDVPVEILEYLKARRKSAALGPAELAPSEDAIVISYDELWGWDMRPIIKALAIHASPVGRPGEGMTVKFEEMTIFNTQPVASSIVPPMMDALFQSAERGTVAVSP